MKQRETAVVLAAVLAAMVGAGDAFAQEQSASVPATANIVNGIPTNQQPTTGALLFVGPNTKNQFLECSGVLIGCRTFLTAAHCLCTQSNNYQACANNELANIDPADLRVFLQHAGIFHVRELYVSPTYLRGSRGDLMMLRLSERVEGIDPSRFNATHGPSIDHGTDGLIAGFGSTGDDQRDAAIKRVGEVNIAACQVAHPEPANVCWNFKAPVAQPGQDSNVCFKDDGGPLFIDFGAGPVVAGIHSGGSSTCDADAFAYDSATYGEREWLASVGGLDVFRDQCSDLGEVGDRWVTVQGAAGELPLSLDHVRMSFNVPDPTKLLRVTVNGDTDRDGDYDMYVRLGDRPTRRVYDCKSAGVGQFGACVFEKPQARTVHVLLRHVSLKARGQSRYQVTATAYAPRPAAGDVPKAPERLRYEIRSEDRRRLTWFDMSSDEEGFEVQRSIGDDSDEFSTRAVVGPDRQFFIDAAAADQIFAYRVRAFNIHGNSDWSNLCMVNRPAPLKPRFLQATDVKEHRVSLQWRDRSDDELGFQIQRRKQGALQWDTVAQLGVDQRTFTDTRLTAGRTYEYRVRARGRDAICVPDSGYTGILTVTTLELE